jgi:hypothetical protein
MDHVAERATKEITMKERRFSDYLRDLNTALETTKGEPGEGKKGGETVRKQVRAAAEAAAPKWKKSGNLEDLGGFIEALPDRLGPPLLAAIAQEIAVRGFEWGRAHLFAAFGEYVVSLKGVGAEA